MTGDSSCQKIHLLDFWSAGGQLGMPSPKEESMPEYEKAMRPEDITRLFVERSNAGDAAGVAALYEEDAVMAYPPGEPDGGPGGDPRAVGEGAGRRAPTSSRNSRCRR